MTIAGGSDNETIEVGSNLETTLRVVDLGGNVNAIEGTLVVNGNAARTRSASTERATRLGRGQRRHPSPRTTVRGLGLGNPLTYGTLELLTIRLGVGDTRSSTSSSTTNAERARARRWR